MASEDLTMEELQAQVQQLNSDLRERDAQVRLAAQYGQELLEQTERLNARIAELEQHDRESGSLLLDAKTLLEEKAHEIAVLQEKVESLDSAGVDSAMGQMRQQIGVLERQVESERSKNKDLQDQFHDVQERADFLASQLRDAENFTSSVGSVNQNLTSKLKDLEKFEKEVSTLTMQNETLHRRIDDLAKENAEAKKQIEEKDKRIRIAAEAERKLQEEKETLEGKVIGLEQTLHGKQADMSSQSDKKKEEIKRLRLEREEAYLELENVKWEKKQFQQQCVSLAKENQRLEKEKEENKEFLDEARNTVTTLRKALEENAAHGGGGSPDLLGQLEAGLNKRIEAEKEKEIEKKKQAEAAGGMENCEEYFFLAATAVKISMATQYPHQSDPLFKISAKTLFNRCISQDVPFHEWHEWLYRDLYQHLKTGPKIPHTGIVPPPMADDGGASASNGSRPASASDSALDGARNAVAGSQASKPPQEEKPPEKKGGWKLFG